VQAVDPAGTHVLGMQLPHNDIEMRTQWICKMRGTEDPTVIWLDVDFDALKECTTIIDIPDPEDNEG